MSELTFSFTDCAPAPLDIQLVVPAPVPEEQTVITARNTGRTAWLYLEKAARRFHGWLTVSAASVIRNVSVSFRRTLFTARALFGRMVFARQGGLRL